MRTAADQWDSGSHFILGVAYANGQGIPQNFVEAHKWYNLTEPERHHAPEWPVPGGHRDAVPRFARAWRFVCLTLDDVVDLDDLRRARKLYPKFGQDRHEPRTERLELLP